MARHTFPLLFCAGVVIGAPLVLLARPEETRPRQQIDDQLAVQKALELAREHLKQGEYVFAVELLEQQISRANGSKEYLKTLRDAYAGAIPELQRSNRVAEANDYLRALQHLDPRAVPELTIPAAPVAATTIPPPPPTIPAPRTNPTANPTYAAVAQTPPPNAPAFTGALPTPNIPATTPTSTPPPNTPPQPAPGGAVVRASGGVEEDVFSEANSKQSELARGFLTHAEQEFLARHYEAAGSLYEQAGKADRNALAGAEERWAYCKLFAVVEALKRTEPPPADVLEREVRLALSLAPKLDTYGKDLLNRIHSNRNVSSPTPGAGPADHPEEARLEVRHTPRGPNQSYALAETKNFRIFHNQPQDVAEKAARVAEAARTAGIRKWFGDSGADAWNPRCDVFLHATAQDYTTATRQPGDCPGHSTVSNDRDNSERIVSRRLDIHIDVPEWWVGVLPHETTHVVLAGRFGPKPLPRWADEGMAVLAEPRDRVLRHLNNLQMHHRNGEWFTAAQLMTMTNYPEPRLIGAFYAESVSLVDFLSHQQGGPQKFAQFMRDCPRMGHEQALKQHYNLNGFADLQARWEQAALGGVGQGTMAEK